MTKTSALKRLLAGSLGVGLAMIANLGFTGSATAHDLVVQSTPENGSTITEPFNKIELNFSGKPKEGYNTVALSRDGEVLVTGEPVAEGKELSLDIPGDVDWQPGEYTVGYQITSSDGHATRGSLKFTYSDDGNTSAADGSSDAVNPTEATSVDNPSDEGIPSWVWPLTGIVVVAGALVMAIARWRAMKK